MQDRTRPNRHARRQVRDAAKVAERRRKKDDAARVAYWQAVREQAASALRENARLRAALERIAEGGPPAEYERAAREALADA